METVCVGGIWFCKHGERKEVICFESRKTDHRAVWICSDESMWDKDGAQIIEITSEGKETLKAVYDAKQGLFIPVDWNGGLNENIG